MKITALQVGPIMTNCYILSDETAGVCACIDPGDEPQRVEQAIAATGCELRAIYLTHGHFDHWTGVRGLLQSHPDVPVYIHKKDVTDGRGGDLLFPRLGETNQRYYSEGDALTLGSLTVSVMETPGHSEGSVCLLAGDVIFAGDTLFRMSCGRTDFPGGSYGAILRSLARLARLEGDYTVYPGHESATTLNFERSHNPYMKQGLSL